MQARTHAVSSVSDLYATDEVELLLEEIRELEAAGRRAEDIQDFEIAGSATGAGGGGGRSPVGTEHSWDSHAHYRRPPPISPAPVAPIYCHLHRLYSLPGLLRLLLVVVSACCCGVIWGTVGLRPWLLPLAGRVRLLLLAALSSFLLHLTVLLLDVTRLTQLFPFDFNKLTLWLCMWSALAYVCGGSLLLHAVLAAPEYTWAPHHIAQLLYAAAGLGLSGFSVSLVLAAVATRGMRRTHAARDTTVLMTRTPSTPTGRSSSVSLRTAYRALPLAEPQPCSSRDHHTMPL